MYQHVLHYKIRDVARSKIADRQNMQTLHRKAPTLSLQACGADNYTNLLTQLFGFLFCVLFYPLKGLERTYFKILEKFQPGLKSLVCIFTWHLLF